MTTTTATQIPVKRDTVRLDGRRERWVVEFVRDNGRVDISRTTGNPRRGGMHYVSTTVDISRLTLVRRGNGTDDIVDAICADLDANRAYREGTGSEADAAAAKANLLRVIG